MRFFCALIAVEMSEYWVSQVTTMELLSLHRTISSVVIVIVIVVVIVTGYAIQARFYCKFCNVWIADNKPVSASPDSCPRAAVVCVAQLSLPFPSPCPSIDS